MRFRAGGRSQACAQRNCSSEALRECGCWVHEAPGVRRCWSVKLGQAQALQVLRWLWLSPYTLGQRPVSAEGPGSEWARPKPSGGALEGLWGLNKGDNGGGHLFWKGWETKWWKRGQRDNHCAGKWKAWHGVVRMWSPRIPTKSLLELLTFALEIWLLLCCYWVILCKLLNLSDPQFFLL